MNTRVPRTTPVINPTVIKPIRTQSGVAIVTLLTMPYPCPGKCVYCPDEEHMPKSYIATEPAAARALALKFDPYLQVRRRIEMLEGNGHPAGKIELIIKGGTWSSYPVDYQQWVIQQSLLAMNETGIVSRTIENTNPKNIYNRFWGEEKASWSVEKLIAEQTRNETSRYRCVGLTIETRPDYISTDEIGRLRILGCTRVELGIQTTDDTILDLIKRGHTTEHSKAATRLLKDAGFKVDYHLMPGLPGATHKKDLASGRDVFSDSGYQPDMIKIYPTVVTPNTILEKWWKEGTYTPYSTEELIPLLARIKESVPPHVRISRVIRDIPSTETVAGNTKTNLRETVQKYMKENGMRCRCLRCREVGHRKLETCNLKLETLNLKISSYNASGGMEYFLSFEDETTDTVYAFLRMRFPSSNAKRVHAVLPELAGAALIRELHTYGQLVPVDQRMKDASQHIGFGSQLLQRAESIARDHGVKKIAVISGVGVREYYRKKGYSLEGSYMVKYLKLET